MLVIYLSLPKPFPKNSGLDCTGPFYWHKLTLIPAWISNCMASKVWDEITYPFSNFNSAIVDVCESISNFIPYLIMDVIIMEIWDHILVHISMFIYIYIYIHTFAPYRGKLPLPSTYWGQRHNVNLSSLMSTLSENTIVVLMFSCMDQKCIWFMIQHILGMECSVFTYMWGCHYQYG